MFKRLIDFVSARKLHIGFYRKGAGPTILLLHGLGCTHEIWEDLVAKLPSNATIIAPDLLGFGDSPKPKLASYSNYVQAKSVIKTLKKLGSHKQLIIVGHSMGGLIAAEVARQKPNICRQLILCGAPIYHTKTNQMSKREDQIFKRIYKLSALKIKDNQTAAIEAVNMMSALGLTPKAMEINHQTIGPYVKALKNSITHQTTFNYLKKTEVKTLLINGLFDPLVIKRNTKILTRSDNIESRTALCSHEFSGAFVRNVARAIARDFN